MKITNPFGVQNQLVITDAMNNRWFQSYETVIACKTSRGNVILNNQWEYSKTTSKYLGRFLGETTKEIRQKVANGTYKLDDLQSAFAAK